MRTIILLTFFISSFINVNGQEKQIDIKTKQFNQHKHEIGIDIQNLFSRYNSLGSSIVYKRRLGEKKFISLNDKKALRFIVGGSGEIPLNRDRLNYDSLSTTDIRDLERSTLQLYGLIGIEWQHQKSRVQYFYGIETGFKYSQKEEASSFVYTNVSIIKFGYYNTTSYSIPINTFGGIKFFFSQEFSLSIESTFSLSYQMERVDRTVYDVVANVAADTKGAKRNEINYNFDYLSSLNFSYYF